MRVPIFVDDPRQREALSKILESKGYRVVTAANDCQPLELDAEPSPAIILLDLGTAAMGGWRVIEKLKREVTVRDTPIIAISGETDLPKNVIALSNPFQIEHLLTLIDWILHERSLRRE